MQIAGKFLRDVMDAMDAMGSNIRATAEHRHN
jgi:hypothetical protein